MRFGELQVTVHLECWEGGVSGEGITFPLRILFLCNLFIWLLICILYNKLLS